MPPEDPENGVGSIWRPVVIGSLVGVLVAVAILVAAVYAPGLQS